MLAAYRRVCVLRRQNRHAEADTLHQELIQPTLAALRLNGDADDTQIQVAFEQEERRVEDAALMAELLLPFLTSATSVASLAPLKPLGGNSTATAKIKPPADNVAAFIDDMLAQSTSGTRH
jgi:hypothetical protein